MSAPDTSNNLLEGENTIEMRTKENVRSLLGRLLALPLSWHVSMGPCGLETKRCCLAKPLKAGASREPQPAPESRSLMGNCCSEMAVAVKHV